MPDDLDPSRRLRGAMAMMEMKALGLPRRDHLDLSAQLPIVISRDHNWLTNLPKLLQQLDGLGSRRSIMHQVAQDDEPKRLIFFDELRQSLRNRRHPPHRHQPARRALAQFVAKMQVGHRQPAFDPMEKREPAIEQNIGGDERLVRTK